MGSIDGQSGVVIVRQLKRQREGYYCLTSEGSFLTVNAATGELDKGFWRDLSPADLARAEIISSNAGGPAAVAFFGSSDALGSIRAVARFELRQAEMGRLCRLHNGFGYLACWPDGPPLANSTNPGVWETFLLIPEQEFADLLAVDREGWWRDAGVCRGDNGELFRPDFKATLVGETVDLAQVHPVCARAYVSDADGKAILKEFVLLNEGWRYAGHFELWRPLVYFTAFGSEAIFEQLRYSMTSLIEYGKYNGDVAVISNRERSFVEQFVPQGLHARLRVISSDAVDFIDYCLARYRIVEDKAAFDNSPLLYVDTDIIFDAPLDPILQRIRSAAALSAAQEPALVRGVDTVGAFLFREAGKDPADALGFNAGCLGIPGLANYQWFYRAVLDVADAYMACRGRSALWLADQPVTNYVAHLAKMIDPNAITDATRVGDLDTSAAKDQRRGFVHFWLVRGQEAKRDALKGYLQALRAAESQCDADRL